MTNEQKQENYKNYLESRKPFNEPVLTYKQFVESITIDDRIEEFKEKHPQYADERFEICDNGDVFIHGNCAYPLIIRKAIESID